MEYLNSVQPWLTWSTAATILLSYLFGLAIYRLYLHPLSQFPGPKLAAVTRWYEGYYDVIQDGQYTFKIRDMHKKYGPIIRISPYELHVNDPAFYNTLYCHEGRWDRYAWVWDAWGAEGPTIHTADHERHRARRQPLAPFFSRAKVIAQQDIIRRNADKLCHRLSQIAADVIPGQRIVNLGAAISAFARDLSFEYTLGRSHNSLDSEDFDVAVLHLARGVGPLWRVTKHVGYVFHIVNRIPLDWLIWILDEKTKNFFIHMKATMQDTKDVMASINNEPTTPQTSNCARRTIVHEILSSKLPPQDKRFQRVFEDVTSVSGAGFETTGSALRLICFHIFSNARILSNLRRELKSAGVEHVESPTNPNSNPNPNDNDNNLNNTSPILPLKTLEKLPYLTATITEGLRLSPGVATRMARIAPDRDIVYRHSGNDRSSYRIPAGTPVGMTTLLLHTDEEIYPDPLSFNPERWINEKRKPEGETPLYAPFSRGTRVCLGMHGPPIDSSSRIITVSPA
ncbi:hypothetical protein NPX13_g11177 [Xylaria arbuscula]|uniref:Trichodiene oxygenase n=1 Tax=Xylaria arbuscula TaxID=114810 RepID=A0A9W8N3E2_9PEZI|nr:hypothetical protein NPX13_g11177 [Xylaria arbuscula]